MLQWFRKQQLSDTNATSTPGGDLHIALTRKLIDFLESQISSQKTATSLLSQIARFKELPPTYQEKELPSLYLKIERFLTEEDPLRKFTRPQLRKTIQYRYEPLMELENFKLIFEPESAQELLLSQLFLKNIIIKIGNTVNVAEEPVLNSAAEWVFHIPEVAQLPMPFNLSEKMPQSFAEWIPLLAKVSQKLYVFLEGKVGEEQAAILFEKVYRELAEVYRPLEAFYVIVQLLPDNLLDENKIGVLNAEQIRNVFLNKLGHLQKTHNELSTKNNELEEAHSDLMVAQDTALESVKLFHSVLDAVEEGVVTADAAGKIIMVNKHILHIFGYAEEELMGQNIQVLMPEKYREPHRQGMKRYLETKKSRAIGQKLVLEGLRKNQTIFPIHIQITQTQISEQLYFTAAIKDISEDVRHEADYKKAVSDLRLSEQRYRNLIDRMPDIIFVLSLDGAFTLINPAFEKSTNWTIGEWIGKPFTQLVHPDDSIAALKMFQQVLQGEEAILEHVRLRKKEGTYLVAELSVMPQLQNGKLVGALGIAGDISAGASDIQKALQIGEKRYQQFIELNPNPAGMYVDGKIVLMNESAAKLLRARDSQQLINKPILDFIHPEFQSAARERLEIFRQPGEKPIVAETKLLRLDGSAIAVKISEIPLVYKNKTAVQFILSEKETSPAGIKYPDNSYQADQLLENLPDAIFVINLDGLILETNPAAGKLYGSEKYAIIGKDFFDLVPVDIREPLSQNIYLMTHQRLDFCDTIALKSNGNPLPVRMWATRMEFKGKTAVLLIIRDISEQSSSRSEKEKLNTELENARSLYREARQKLHVSSVKFEENEFKLRNIQLEFEDLQLKLQSAQLKYQEAHSKLENAQQKNREAENELQTLRQQLSAAQARMKEMQNQPPNNSSRELQTENQVLQAKLQNAQLKIKKLSELVPISPENKQIRDDHAFWQRIGEAMEDSSMLSLIQEFSSDFNGAAPAKSSKTRNGLQ